jgi:hypothetical protein
MALIFNNKKTEVGFRNVALKGDPGVSITSLQVTPANELLVSYSNGRIQNAGVIHEQDPSVPVAVQDDFVAQEGQTDFVLSQEPSQVTIITINGIQQKKNLDFVIVENILQFNFPLTQDDIIIATYSIPLSSLNTYDKKFTAINNTPNNANTGTIALLISENETTSFSGMVVIKDLDNTSIASFKITGCVNRFSSVETLQFIGTPQIVLIGKNENANYNGYDLQLSVNKTNSTLEIKTIYQRGGSIRATAIINILEVF